MGWLTDAFIGLFERLTYNEIFRFLGDTKLPQNNRLLNPRTLESIKYSLSHTRHENSYDFYDCYDVKKKFLKHISKGYF